MNRILVLVDEGNIQPEDYLRAAVALVQQGALSGVRVAGRFFSYRAPDLLENLPSQVQVENSEEVRSSAGLAGYLALTDPPIVYGRQLGAIRPLCHDPVPEEVLALVSRAVTLLRLVGLAENQGHAVANLDAQVGVATVGDGIHIQVIGPMQSWVSSDTSIRVLQPIVRSAGAVLREEVEQ